ncbi:MAG: hypothetical protein ACSHX6_03125 [Akkermansiaceae bacterium]
MKKLITNLIVMSATAFSLSSCGDDSKKDSEGSGGSSSSTLSVESKFDDLGPDLQSVLSADEVKSILDVKDEIKTKALDHKSYGNVSYSWPSDRTEELKVGGNSMVMKKNNMVRLVIPKELELYGMTDHLSAFNHQYKEITPEQMEKAKNMMADIKARKEKEAGLTPSETEKKVSGSLMNGIAGAALKLEYEAVSGLGDAAKWEKSGKNLIILDGDKIVTILCDINDENDVCRDSAIKIAKQVYSNL